MDVSHGLINKFVKCKTIKHALSPISSQVSLLIIIVEQQTDTVRSLGKDASAVSGSGKLVLDVAACVSHLSEAVADLVRAGEKQSASWKNEEFANRMSGACESLSVASNQLSILSHRFSSGHTPQSNVKNPLCQAAKDVLHGVLKIFIVIDDFQVRQVLSKVNFVEEAVTEVVRVEKSQLIQSFKALTFSVLTLKAELKKRCSNLLSKACREQLLVWLGVLQNCVPSLSVAAQTKLKYKENLDAKASVESVEHEMKEACKKIRQLLLTGPQEEVEDELVNFVGLIDNVMEGLSEDNRSKLASELECDLVILVQHSMGVAHMAESGSHRDLVVGCCHRILQAKFRLFDLYGSLKDGQMQRHIRVDFDNTCETLLDEVCDLERQVNMTLLQLIIHTFLCPVDEIRPLRRIARNDKGDKLDHVTTINRFTEFSESLCRVAQLVASSSTDSSKIREIGTAVRCIESIEAEIGPAVLLTATKSTTPHQKNEGGSGTNTTGCYRHLELLLDWWSREVQSVLTAVDTIVDPRVFMDMTETIIGEELETLRDLVGRDQEELCAQFYRLRHLAQRPVQLARRLQEESNDAIYRNGLGVFIQLLVQRISDATQSFQEAVSQDLSCEPSLPMSPRLLDTLHRRMCLVQKAVGTLRDGLNMRTHPELMSEHRRTLFTPRPVQVVHEHIKIKKEKEDNRSKAAQAQANELKKRKKEEKSTNLNANEKDLNKEAKPASPVEFTDKPAATVNKVSHAEAKLKFPAQFETKEQEGGYAKEIYGLVRRLVTSCVKQDQPSVEVCTHSVLSWTNHIVENAEVVLTHCQNLTRESELRESIKAIDKLAPEVIQRAKFVNAGDTEDVHLLMGQAIAWANKLNSARVVIDVASDRWLVLTSQLQTLSESRDQHKLKLVVSSITNAQKEMTSLLLKTRFLSGHFLPDGHQQIQFLTDSHSEIENLAITIKTAVDVSTISGSSPDHSSWWQLTMACREWSVLMTAVAAELDKISDIMGDLAGQRIPSLAVFQVNKTDAITRGGGDIKGLRLADCAQRETDILLELVDCVTVGDATLKDRSEEMVKELQEALADIFSVAKQPVMPKQTSLHALLCRLRIGLAKSRWIEKALDLQDMIRNCCFQYMGFARTLLLDAQDISFKEESEGVGEVSEERHKVSVHFLEISSALKVRALKAIQLCPELNRRAVVRSTLDSLSKLTTQIGDVMRAPGPISDAHVYCFSDQWGARMKKLLTNLGKMEGVKSSAVSDLEKFNRGGPPSAIYIPVSGDPQLMPSISGQARYMLQQETRPGRTSHMQHAQQAQTIHPYHNHQQLQQQETKPGRTSHIQHAQQAQTIHQDYNHQHSIPSYSNEVNSPQVQSYPYQHQKVSSQPSLPGQQLPHLGQNQFHNPQQAHYTSNPSQSFPLHYVQAHANNANAQFKPENDSQNLPQEQQKSHPSQQHKHLVLNQPRHQFLWQQHNQPPQQMQQPYYHNIQQHPDERVNKAPVAANMSNKIQRHVQPLNPVPIVLKDAEYLGLCLKKWRGDGVRHLKPVQAALEMAKLCSEMALYTRGQGNLKSSTQVSESAADVVLHSKDVEVFGQTLLGFGGHGRTRDHVQVCNNKIQACSSQLHIIATALHNSARSHEGDLILVRNASNLLTAVRQLFSLAEAIAAKKPSSSAPTSASDEMTRDAITLLSTLREENDRYLAEDRHSGPVDSLGLRRVEIHRPPSLASLLDDEEDKDRKMNDAQPFCGEIFAKFTKENNDKSKADPTTTGNVDNEVDSKTMMPFVNHNAKSSNDNELRSKIQNNTNNKYENHKPPYESNSCNQFGNAVQNGSARPKEKIEVAGQPSKSQVSTATSPIVFEPINSAENAREVPVMPADQLDNLDAEDIIRNVIESSDLISPDAAQRDRFQSTRSDKNPVLSPDHAPQIQPELPALSNKKSNIDESDYLSGGMHRLEGDFERNQAQIDTVGDVSLPDTTNIGNHNSEEHLSSSKNDSENKSDLPENPEYKKTKGAKETFRTAIRYAPNATVPEQAIEVQEERIEKVMSPSSELDVDKLLNDLDEAIETGGKGTRSPVKSPPASGIVSPVTVNHSFANVMSPPATIQWRNSNAQQTRQTSKDIEDGDVKIDKYGSFEEEFNPGKAFQNVADDTLINNLDTSENSRQSNDGDIASQLEKSKKSQTKKHKKRYDFQPHESNDQSNQSEEELESILGGASVHSFLLQSEDLFSDTTKGYVPYDTDQDTPPLSPSQRLTAVKSPDSSSEAGLASAKSFLLSHEDVFSEKKGTWDTNF